MPTVDQIAAAINDETAAVLLTLPNNPTGTTMSKGDLQAIHDLCRDNDVQLIVDEIFHGLMYEGKAHPTVPYNPEDGTLVRIRGWSKDRGIPGSRIGYVVASEAIINRMANTIGLTLGNAPTAPYKFVVRDIRMRLAMLQPETLRKEDQKQAFPDYVRRINANLALYEENHRTLEEGLRTMEGVEDTVETEGGYAKFVKFKGVRNGVVFAEHLFANTGVMTVPGEAFLSDPGWIRFTFSVPHETVTKGLELIERYLRESRKK